MLTGEGVDVIVHSTHEAGYKIGGIGAVLDGLLSSRAYLKNVRRTVLTGPFSADDTAGMERLRSPRNRMEILYSSLDGTTSYQHSSALEQIERRHGVRIIYGRRSFAGFVHDVLLVDPKEAEQHIVNDLKYRLWERFGLQSDLYEGSYEYDLYVRSALPQFEALQVILGGDANRRRKVVMAHEFMGVPLCLVAELERPGSFCRVYYAHEVPTVRPVVEEDPGHDTMFYNVLRLARSQSLQFHHVFGSRAHFYKHALLEASADFSAVFAVGDLVVEELRFLGPQFANKAIDLVYNGIPAPEVPLEAKLASLTRLRDYAERVTGRRPDYVFTHVARLVPSKGLWRDLRVLENLDPMLSERGLTATFFVLATAPPTGRSSQDVLRMEQEYGWPVDHREGYPDLVGYEVPFYQAVRQFNHQAKAVQAIFVNQFGWDQERCGQRMPAEMTFADLRQGSDLEFGQSIYEPFGIAQFEPLPYGALCVVSSACGCVGFANRVATGAGRNIIVADYISLPPGLGVSSWQEALQIGQDTRDLVERYRAREAAEAIATSLPRDDLDRERSMQSGLALAKRMSWEVVVSEYMLPALARALHSVQ
ncbi:MAG: hypothetical protein HPY83_18460 [Anaerolineae bacterium]|nr:hypothetical protein [Anaerolineae bacterium]